MSLRHTCAIAQVPDRGDGEYQRLCHQAVGAYRRAAAAMPDEWNYHFYLGKMLAKAGEGACLLQRLLFPRFLSGEIRRPARRCLGYSLDTRAESPQAGGLLS